MPTKDEMFPSKWLKAADIDALGGSVVVEILRTQLETVGHGAQAATKVVLYFKGNPVKPMIVGNIANWDSLVEITGYTDANDWAGYTIELYAIDVTGPNGPTRGIRIRKPKAVTKAAPASTTPPKKKPAAPPPPEEEFDSDDDIPI